MSFADDDVGEPREGSDLARRILRSSLALFVALRSLAILVADHPTITPDEFGSWSIAAHLVGGRSLSMQDMPTYPLVPGMVLTPIEALPLGATTSYQLALVVLSGFAVAAAVLVRRTVQLLAPGEPVIAAGAFGLVLLLPAHLTTGALTWSEPTVLLWWCLLFWAFAAALVPDSRTSRRRALAIGSLAAGSAPFVHGRLTAAPAVWAGVLLVVLWLDHRRSDAASGSTREKAAGDTSDETSDGSPGRPSTTRSDVLAVIGAGVLTVSVAATLWMLNRQVRSELWTEPIGHDTATLRDAIGSPDMWATLAATAVGQLWYIVVSSFGLAAFGVAALVSMWRRRESLPHRALAASLGVLTLSNIALSTVAMTVGGYLAATDGGTGGVTSALRWSHLYYGRYNDAATVVLSVLGVLWLWSGARARTTVVIASVTGVLTACAAGVITVRASGLRLDERIDATVAGVAMVPAGRGAISPVIWTVVGSALMAAVVASSLRGRRQLVRSLICIVGITAVLSGLSVARLQRSVTVAPVTAQVGAAPIDGAVATVASDTAQLDYLRLGVFGIQHQLLALGWSMEFSELDSEGLARSAAPPDRRLLVLSDGDDPGDGWVPVARFEGSTFWSSDPPS